MKSLKYIIILIMILFMCVGFTSYDKYLEDQQTERCVAKMYEMTDMTPTTSVLDLKLKEIEEKEEEERKLKELEDWYNSEEYKELQYIKEIEEKYDIDNRDYDIVTFELTYYTDLASENGGYANLTASGDKLRTGHVANNQLPFGTNIYIEGHGVKVVKDRGAKSYFNRVNRVDVYVPKNAGESDTEYFNRVNAMGRVKKKGVIFYT